METIRSPGGEKPGGKRHRQELAAKNKFNGNQIRKGREK
jgi:hypothetical protein